MESAHRTSLAKGEVGIREKKSVPTLAKFISVRFAPWAEASTSRKTWLDYYRPGIRKIQEHRPLANLRLSDVTSENLADFAAWRQSAGLQVSSVNNSPKSSAASYGLPLSGVPPRWPRRSECFPARHTGSTS